VYVRINERHNMVVYNSTPVITFGL